MDARAVPELSTTRNRFRGLPLSGSIADGRCREYGSSLYLVAQSCASGRNFGGAQFLKWSHARVDVSSQPELKFRIANRESRISNLEIRNFGLTVSVVADHTVDHMSDPTAG